MLSMFCVNAAYIFQKVIGKSVKQAVLVPLYTVPERCGPVSTFTFIITSYWAIVYTMYINHHYFPSSLQL